MSTNACTVLSCESDIVGAYRHETTVSNFHFTMQFDEEFCLPTVFGTKAPATEYENHGMRTLEFRKFTAFGSMVGEFVVGEDRAGNDVRSHVKNLRELDARCRVTFHNNAERIFGDQEFVTLYPHIASKPTGCWVVRRYLGSA